MKKIIIILLATVITTAASATPAAPLGGGHGGWHGGGFHRPVRTVIVGGGFYNPWYSPWGYYGFSYPWYATPPTPPSKLDLQLSTIRVNYADKIKSVRMNKDLPRQERRIKIKDLKTQREHELIDAKKSFYKY